MICVPFNNNNNLLPAATKLGQGNIFTSVCLSTGGGGLVWRVSNFSGGGFSNFSGGSPIFRGGSPNFFFFFFSISLPVKNFFWDAPNPPPPH